MIIRMNAYIVTSISRLHDPTHLKIYIASSWDHLRQSLAFKPEDYDESSQASSNRLRPKAFQRTNYRPLPNMQTNVSSELL